MSFVPFVFELHCLTRSSQSHRNKQHHSLSKLNGKHNLPSAADRSRQFSQGVKYVYGNTIYARMCRVTLELTTDTPASGGNWTLTLAWPWDTRLTAAEEHPFPLHNETRQSFSSITKLHNFNLPFGKCRVVLN